MRRRRTSGRVLAPRELSFDVHDWRGEAYVVRAVSGAAAAKAYRCPGCDHEISPGRPHRVVWPSSATGAADRRHWHTACWEARHSRGIARGRQM